MNTESTTMSVVPAKRVPIDLLRAISILTVLGILTTSFVLATDIFLILFLGVLFGVFLTKCAAFLSRRVPIGYRGCLAFTVATLLLSTIGAASLFFVQINRQIEQTSGKIDEGIQELRSHISNYPAVRSIVASTPLLSDMIGFEKQESVGSSENTDKSKGSSNGKSIESQNVPLDKLTEPVKQAVGMIGPLFKSTLGLVVNSLLIFFVGLFLAVSPTSNRDGVVQLIPTAKRQRVTEVLNSVGEALWRWLIGRFGSMLATGGGAFLLLLSLGIPLAGTLGMLTAILTFVPNIGGALALLLALLIALPQGTTVVGAVIAGYLVLQLFESYVITPLIQQKAVSLPPALLMAFQAIFGVMFGFIGAAVASPVLAAGKTAVQMLYIEDYLGAREG